MTFSTLTRSGSRSRRMEASSATIGDSFLSRSGPTTFSTLLATCDVIGNGREALLDETGKRVDLGVEALGFGHGWSVYHVRPKSLDAANDTAWTLMRWTTPAPGIECAKG